MNVRILISLLLAVNAAGIARGADVVLDKAWFEGLVNKYYSAKVRSAILPEATKQANVAYADENERWQFLYSFFDGYRSALEDTGNGCKIGDGANPHQAGFDAGQEFFNQTQNKGGSSLALTDFGYEPVTARGTYVAEFEASDFRPEGKIGKWWVDFRRNVAERFAQTHSLEPRQMFDEKRKWRFKGYLAPDRGSGVGHFNQYDREFLVTEILDDGHADVISRDIAEIRVFAFGGIGYAGETSTGEALFQKLWKRKDALEQFVRLYASGSDEAQVYAMVAFYYLDRTLYDHIKSNYDTTKINIRRMRGCNGDVVTLGELLREVEQGQYKRCIPEADKDEPPAVTSPAGGGAAKP